MNPPFISIEHHQIDMRYRHTRILDDAAIERIGRSISQYGQLQPISVITDATGRYILIDGYLRVEACKRRGLDTVSAVCLCDEKQALIQGLRDGTPSIYSYLHHIKGMSSNFHAEKSQNRRTWSGEHGDAHETMETLETLVE